MGLIAIGAAIAVLTGAGAGVGIGIATAKATESMPEFYHLYEFQQNC